MSICRLGKGFTLVEVMIVVAVIGLIVAIAIPAFLRARDLSRMRACQENLQKVFSAKEQWALEGARQVTEVPTWDELVGVNNYIRHSPSCPTSGTYSIGQINEDPTCSMSSDVRYPHLVDAQPPGSY